MRPWTALFGALKWGRFAYVSALSKRPVQSPQASKAHAEIPPTTMPVTLGWSRGLMCFRPLSHVAEACVAINSIAMMSTSPLGQSSTASPATISNSGPSTPPKAMAPSNQGHSWFGKPGDVQPLSRTNRIRVKPSPLPRFKAVLPAEMVQMWRGRRRSVAWQRVC